MKIKWFELTQDIGAAMAALKKDMKEKASRTSLESGKDAGISVFEERREYLERG